MKIFLVKQYSGTFYIYTEMRYRSETKSEKFSTRKLKFYQRKIINMNKTAIHNLM